MRPLLSEPNITFPKHEKFDCLDFSDGLSGYQA